MVTKYTCLNSYCSFTTSSESAAMQHISNNPDHKIAKVEDEGDTKPDAELIDVHHHNE